MVVSSTLPVPSTTATLTPVRMPGSSPIVAREPAGAASSRSFRLRGKDLDRLFLGPLAQLAHQIERECSDSFTRQVQPATSISQRSPRPAALRCRRPWRSSARPA